MDFDVPDSIKHVAMHASEWHFDRGYVVSEDDEDPSLPQAPTYTARREHKLCIVEAVDAIDSDRMERWVLYGKGSDIETRVSICIDDSHPGRAAIGDYCVENGLGLIVVSDGVARELHQARDLTANLAVPSVRHEPDHVKAALGEAVEKYERGDWHSGFSDAVREFESLAKRRLGQLVRQGVTFSPIPGRNRAPSETEAENAMLGEMEQLFAMVDPQTAESVELLRVVKYVRAHRNSVMHDPASPEVRAKAIKLLYALIRGVRTIPV